MRILMLCPQFRPLVGGYERAAERLSAELVARGHEVCVLAERKQRNWAKRELVQGFVIRRVFCIYRRGLHMPSSLCSFAAWLLARGREFDVWHVHQYGAHATLAVLLGRLLRRPVVLKLTSSMDQGVMRSLGQLRLTRLHRWAHRQVAACIAVSSETVDEALLLGVSHDRVWPVGNGVDVAEYIPVSAEDRAVMRERLGLGPGLIAVTVGRLAEEKNPLGLLSAWKEASSRLPEGSLLVLVGGGPLLGAIVDRANALDVGGCVRLVGHTDRVLDWLQVADIFLLPSRNEGMANTLLEAMAAGLPSVATAVSGTQQLLVETSKRAARGPHQPSWPAPRTASHTTASEASRPTIPKSAASATNELCGP